MKEKKYELFKLITIMILISVVLTWLIPAGSYATTGYTNQGMLRFGLHNIELLVYQAYSMGAGKILFLLALGGFYGILSHLNAYENIVTSLAKKFSKHKEITIVITSVLIAILTSVFINSFVILIFIPFIISILHKMKLDKMTILATTFGSMLVGILGATFGSDGLLIYNQYVTSQTGSLKDTLYATILIRAGILGVGLVLFNFFTLNHLNKTKDLETATMFEIETSKDKKSIIPLIIIGVLTVIIVILGYVDWTTNFNISIFDDFHEFISNVKIGKDFYVIKSIIGDYPSALGTWDIYTIPPMLLIFAGILGLCYRIKLNDFISYFIDGIKKVIKPILVVIGLYAFLSVVYSSPYVPTIINKVLSLTEGFNLATMLVSSIILNIFHPELGYTGMTMGQYLITEYVDYINPINVIMTTIYGLIQFFIPTSLFLGIGLTTLNVSYKDWLKYIWKFILGMFICLLVIFILITLL